ncbi:MAG TPA: TIGR04053 family radical SAM/SPASM domain-containing protein [Thermoanaerobaculia bacterium]|nr:TIGR04053 family radical SAM/SPASM domain-containing protein [Thermoanaerobaculia bacterium]
MGAVNFDVSPFVVIWENTRACDLACVHCRAAAQPRRSQFELTTEEGFRLIDEIAVMQPKVFVITGGDPLKRDDTYLMIQHARMRGLEPSLTPSATPLLTDDAVSKMKAHGLGRIAVSLDGATAESHDGFRRVPGSFDITINAIRAAVREGIPVQVNTTVTRRTIDELPQIVELLDELGIVMWSVFFVVPTGRAKITDLVTADEVEELFGFLYETSRRVPFAIRTTEAMHYRRYMLQRMLAEKGQTVASLRDPATGLIDPSTLFLQNGPRAMPLGVQMNAVSRAPRGVNEAKGLVFISHIGDVFPSGFLALKAGNVKKEPLAEIYRSSSLFVGLRDNRNLNGKCGCCEFRDLCGGSRARAWSMTGDMFGADPLCSYQPGVA